MGFFKQVAAAIKPPSIGRQADADRPPSDPDPAEPGLDAMTPEERSAYEANAAAVAQSRAAAEARERERTGEAADHAEREAVAAAERASRDAARAPYRAADPAEIAIRRVSTRGATQLAELLDHLRATGLASRPDRVFGVYRVPDRIHSAATPASERAWMVEWDVVHVPAGDAEASAERPVATSFVGTEQWVARGPGEPAVLEEELAAAFCVEAGIGPERCLGLARISEFHTLSSSGEESSPSPTLVRGVVAIHPPESSGAFARMQAAAPLVLPPDSPDVHHEVLDWAAIARVVQPDVGTPAPVPSPVPHLPATPQELLGAYLEIVGLSAADCYGVQVTVDEPPIPPGGSSGTDATEQQRDADGASSRLGHRCEHVVISYRDRSAYVTGRERWSAYQEDVLDADLRAGDGT